MYLVIETLSTAVNETLVDQLNFLLKNLHEYLN
jgi:hypothetical protein